MVKADVLVDLFFGDLPFQDRIPKIAECGYKAIETWKGSDAELLKKMGKACSENKVEFVSIVMNGVGENAVAPSWKGNLKPFIERIDRFSDNALAAGCRSGIVTSGNLADGHTMDEQYRNLVEALKKAGEVVTKKGFILNLEPLNTLVDHKGYYLDCRETALKIIREVNMPSVKMLYDIYHMDIMHGHQVDFITKNISDIGHFHTAGVSGRHELFIGETNYPFVIAKAVEAGYKGYFGLEYIPTMDSVQSLKKTLDYLNRQA